MKFSKRNSELYSHARISPRICFPAAASVVLLHVFVMFFFLEGLVVSVEVPVVSVERE